MRLQFVLGELFNGLRRNFAMAVSVVIVTFVSLTFVGSGLLLNSQINTMKGYWYDKVQINVYMCTNDSTNVPTCTAGEVTEGQYAAVKAVLAGPDLKSYIKTTYEQTKQQTFDDFKARFGDQPQYASVTVDQLPRMIRIELANPSTEQADVVVSQLTGREGVMNVVDQQKVFQGLFDLLSKAAVAATGFAVIMLLAAVMLISTTIRMSAFNRRRETAIMRLVGASNLFIRLPFLLEGAISAAVGAGLASVGLWAAVKFGVQGQLVTTQQDIAFITTSSLWPVIPILFGIGIVLAVGASIVSLNKYLRV
ncbi:ABC transporter permease [Micrococcales bacterium 31B]|nr:ABC transporter permease [Micrococcales bacterium 31B]